MDLFIAWDGDHIGQKVGRAALADDVEGLRRISQSIDSGNKLWESWVNSVLGELISYGGDEGRARIPADKLDELDRIRQQYAGLVGSSVSVGVGVKLSEADRALLAGKLQGGDRITLYTPEVEQQLARVQYKDHEQKLYDEYLKSEDIHDLFQGLFKDEGESPDPVPEATAPENKPNAGGGFSYREQPGGQDSPMGPVAEGSEHSQGEAAMAMLDEMSSPEGTHAAEDFEEELHDHAQESEDEESAEAQAGQQDDVKAQVVQILQQVKQVAPELEQLRDQAPDLYAAVMGVVQALLITAHALTGAEDQGEESVQKSEQALKKASSLGWKPAFRERDSGEIRPCHEGYHDMGVLPGGSTWGWDDGFVDHEGTFYSREEATQALNLNGTNSGALHAAQMREMGKAEGQAPVGLQSPPKPQLHGTVEGFMGGLKSIPKTDTVARGKFVTAHMGHPPFVAALQAHPQGKQVHGMLMGFLNSKANAGPGGPTKTVVKAEKKGGCSNHFPVKWGGVMRCVRCRKRHRESEQIMQKSENGVPKFVSAAFRFPTGRVVQTGAWHDIDHPDIDGMSDEEFDGLQHGFVDHVGKFYTREEAATAVGLQGLPYRPDLPEENLEKVRLPEVKPVPTHHHLNLPVGSTKDGKVKVQHEDGKSTWVSVRAGQVLSNDGHPVSSRNPGGR